MFKGAWFHSHWESRTNFASGYMNFLERDTAQVKMRKLLYRIHTSLSFFCVLKQDEPEVHENFCSSHASSAEKTRRKVCFVFNNILYDIKFFPGRRQGEFSWP